MFEWFKDFDSNVQAASIAAGVAIIISLISLPFKHLLKRRLYDHKLRADYDNEQRRLLRTLRGQYSARFAELGERWSRRMFNLYENQAKGWLDVKGEYSRNETRDGEYYYRSTVYRFLSVVSLMGRFESEALYIDSRIALKDDLEFVQFIKALFWAMTDIRVFQGCEYDWDSNTDHFYEDYLRSLTDRLWDGDRFPTSEEFWQTEANNNLFHETFKFFDGVSKSEGRLRWDRLVVFHLLLVSFLNRFGYAYQKTDKSAIKNIVSQFVEPCIRENFIKWVRMIGVEKIKEVRYTSKLVKTAK